MGAWRTDLAENSPHHGRVISDQRDGAVVQQGMPSPSDGRHAGAALLVSAGQQI